MAANLIMHTDSYKMSHWKFLPPGIENSYYYLESRGGDYRYSVFFGLQALIKKYLERRITSMDMTEAILHAGRHFKNCGDVINIAGWQHILRDHKGWLPLSIKAVPEGSVINQQNVLMTVENTCPKCAWVPGYFEGLMVQLWYPITVATISRHLKEMILGHLNKSGTPEDIGSKLHDFGFRGSTSPESAMIGGAAHLINFTGTDTLPALQFLRDYYQEGDAGWSIPATDHGCMSSWGRDRELDACRNALEVFPSGAVAVVSDTYNIYNACRSIWGGSLKDKVLERDGVLIIRPDSGNQGILLRDMLQTLEKAFGSSENEKGYKVLNPKVRLIQGDGNNYSIIDRTLMHIENEKYSADNIAFGMGAGLLQDMNRDTLQIAMKCSSVVVGGSRMDVWKDPITDNKKRSKRGRLALEIMKGGLPATVREENAQNNLLREVFRDGKILELDSLERIRERAEVD